ncbi:hypothetical protein A0H81_09339 [Grifola frondosa]|uniref:Uncharacterized protein n=1 Tax=Grifola frondosa TaxID=5627 RepID=A0A1C7M175_GRIFR|nr:hypothetical protein A0H81_09339 [Grifola frondosa]
MLSRRGLLIKNGCGVHKLQACNLSEMHVRGHLPPYVPVPSMERSIPASPSLFTVYTLFIQSNRPVPTCHLPAQLLGTYRTFMNLPDRPAIIEMIVWGVRPIRTNLMFFVLPLAIRNVRHGGSFGGGSSAAKAAPSPALRVHVLML